MKKSKILLGLIGVLVVSLAVSHAFADPKLGLVASNKRKNIVRDPLINGAGMTTGWVTFACESLEGFQYSVAVKSLSPSTTLTVRAESLAFIFVPGIGLIPTTDGGGHTYSLGQITTNSEGEGEVKGLFPLAPGAYGWAIIVSDGTTDLLWSPSDDPPDFAVFPSWP